MILRRRRAPPWLLAAGLALAAAGDVAAQRPSAAAVVLEGVVRDAETRAPVDGAAVVARTPVRESHTVTGPDGFYRLEVPYSPRIRVAVHRPGYGSVELELESRGDRLVIDVLLEARPILITPLQVLALSSRALAVLSDEAVAPAAGRMIATARAQVAPPLLPPLRFSADGDGGGSGGGGGGGGGGVPETLFGELRVAGSAARQGAAYFGAAPVQLAGPVSPVADAFVPLVHAVRVRDGGAPARFSGGVEYIVELADEPLLRRPEAYGEADRRVAPVAAGWVDALGVGAAVDLPGPRAAIAFDARSSLPWNDVAIGESGHRWRAARFATSLAPGVGHVLRASGLARAETVPLALDTLSLPSEWRDAGASVGHEWLLGPGALAWSVGAGSFEAVLPLGIMTATGRRLNATQRRDQTRVAAEYRTTSGEGLAFGLGADWHGQVLRGAYPTAQGEQAWRSTYATTGAYGDVAYASPGALLLRAGLRVERLDGANSALRLAPRAQARWQLGHSLAFELGAGVHHQALPVPADSAPDPTPSAPEGRLPARFARGAHYTAGIAITRGTGEAEARVYHKRLRDLPVHDAVRVWGASAGVAVAAAGATLGLSYNVERRASGSATDSTTTVTSHALAAALARPVLLGVEARLAASVAQGAGLGGVSALTTDTLFVGATGIDDADRSFDAVRVDVELARSFRFDAMSLRARPYIRLLNALATDERRLALVDDASPARRAPRVLVLGVTIVREP